ADAGIAHSYDGPWEHFVGGGVASFDCSGDRKPDLLLAGGSNPARLYLNQSAIGGELAFEERALDLPERLLTGVIGAYPLDIDGDAHLDLAILRVGQNLLLKGGPDCSFTRANSVWGYDGGRAWTTAFAATWERGLPAPTLAFGNYIDRTAPGSPWGTCDANVLARPAETESGAIDYAEALPLDPGHCALSMLFTDWNRSGTPALRITNDRHYYRGGEEQLWQMREGRAPRLFTAGEGWERLTIWGMGIAEADLDADGLPEYALTSMGDTKLQTLDEEIIEEDRPTYRDIAFERGATAHRPYAGGDIRPSTGWHAQFADVNNDSLTDLFIAKGNVEAMPDFAANDPDNLLLGRWDGVFAESGETAGIARPTRGRGGAVVDLNLDGLLDLVVVNRAAPTAVFRNRGAAEDWGTRPMGNWLQIELSQEAATGPADIIGADWDGTNRTAVGAKLHIRIGNRTIVRQVQVGGGHASGQAGWIHVGLGVSERASVRVQWPDGAWSHPYRVFANQFVVLKRGAGEAAYWYPAQD
ncbi:MAG: FG-GAP-like repeat-containing protein, partial [Pseudomonadota bacterium]